MIRSLQGENECGRISGVESELRLRADLSPESYRSRFVAGDDTTDVLEVSRTPEGVHVREKEREPVDTTAPSAFFPVHGNIPAAMELALYQLYLARDMSALPTLPCGEVRLTFRQTDVVDVGGSPTRLDRYVVEGINCGLRRVWLDANSLVAPVQANTQFREAIRSGYEEALPFFVAGHVEEQMRLGGLTPFEALRTATLIPARVMGMDGETGSLEVGNEADIAILDRNPLADISNLRSVVAVMTDGAYYESRPLWEAADSTPATDEPR